MSNISTQAFHRKAPRLTVSATTDAKGESLPTEQLIHASNCSAHWMHRFKIHGEAVIVETIHEALGEWGLSFFLTAA
jgi:hypothetical protein